MPSRPASALHRVSSRPVPAKAKTASGTSRTTRAAARRSRSGFFCRSSRPTKATTGAPSGSRHSGGGANTGASQSDGSTPFGTTTSLCIGTCARRWVYCRADSETQVKTSVSPCVSHSSQRCRSRGSSTRMEAIFVPIPDRIAARLPTKLAWNRNVCSTCGRFARSALRSRTHAARSHQPRMSIGMTSIPFSLSRSKIGPRPERHATIGSNLRRSSRVASSYSAFSAPPISSSVMR